MMKFIFLQDSVNQYHASVTHIPDEDIIATMEAEESEEKRNCCYGAPVAVKSVLFKMFDLKLCTSPTFLLLSLSGVLALFSLFIPFNFLPTFINDKKVLLGLTDEEVGQTTTFTMSLIGICNTVGRVVCGWVSDKPEVDAILVNIIALIAGGVATCLIPFINSVFLLYAYALTFGFSIAVFASLRYAYMLISNYMSTFICKFYIRILLDGPTPFFYTLFSR